MFETLDIFVFTLGLTEAWINSLDGSVYPVAPGIITANTDLKQYRFINFDYDSVVADLMAFVDRFRGVNPAGKIILTVSPVPLIATAENRHVLCSTTLSKSVLRAAADKISSAYSFVEYLPSYEIIAGNFNRGTYFAGDLRTVTRDGVKHVMKVFFENCTESEKVMDESVNESVNEMIKDEMDAIAEVLCDEELINK